MVTAGCSQWHLIAVSTGSLWLTDVWMRPCRLLIASLKMKELVIRKKNPKKNWKNYPTLPELIRLNSHQKLVLNVTNIPPVQKESRHKEFSNFFMSPFPHSKWYFQDDSARLKSLQGRLPWTSEYFATPCKSLVFLQV